MTEVLEIVPNDTGEQRGKGVCLANGFVSNAAHSAILPSLMDINTQEQHDTRSKKIPNAWSLDSVEFSSALNSTVELPICFNHFDRHYIERDVRHHAREILNLVAKKQLTPIAAFNQFFAVMEKQLRDKYEQYCNNIEALTQSPPEIRRAVFETEWEGTFACKWDFETNQCNPAYIASLLRIPEATWRAAVASNQEHVHYTNIQHEILTARREEKTPSSKSSNKTGSSVKSETKTAEYMKPFVPQHLSFLSSGKTPSTTSALIATPLELSSLNSYLRSSASAASFFSQIQSSSQSISQSNGGGVKKEMKVPEVPGTTAVKMEQAVNKGGKF